MSSSLLYEVHTRRWLRSLTEREGREVSLRNVPDWIIKNWRELGVSHLWLMGVWSTGPASRDAYLRLPGTAERLRSILPNWKPEHVSASPYAIRSYTVAEEFGGEDGLADFRRTLRAYGIRLILDFVPNHVGLDHPWLSIHPDRFVRSSAPEGGFFRKTDEPGPAWIAHGKDPYFPAWIDTAQLDLRLEKTQQCLIEVLRGIATRCDGVRCDMAMLALRDVFKSNWSEHPPVGAATETEFWDRAISEVRRPGFLFIAEAYWDLEPRLLELGFDYAYDKRVTDYLVHHQWSELEKHLARCPEARLRRSVHFLENHDEPRITGRLSTNQHALAAFLITALPGMSLIFDGQLDGARLQAPVQLARNPPESDNPEIANLYHDLFALWESAGVAGSDGKLISTSPTISILWRTSPSRHVLAVINGRATPQDLVLNLSAPGILSPIQARSLRKQPLSLIAETISDGCKLTVPMPAETFDLLELRSRN